MRTFLFIVAAVSILLGTSQAVSACSCELVPTALDGLARAKFVFAGTAVEIDEQGEFEGSQLVFTKFEVDQSWKGIDGEEITISSELTYSQKIKLHPNQFMMLISSSNSKKTALNYLKKPLKTLIKFYHTNIQMEL